MRVMQLGVGSVGEVVARTLAAEPDVDQVVLADIDGERLREVASKLSSGKEQQLVLVVGDTAALRRALGDVDLPRPQRVAADRDPALRVLLCTGEASQGRYARSRAVGVDTTT